MAVNYVTHFLTGLLWVYVFFDKRAQTKIAANLEKRPEGIMREEPA